MRKVIFIGLACFLTATTVFADNLIIESGTPALLHQIQANAAKQSIRFRSPGDIVAWSALQSINQPYVGGLLDKTTPEYLYISLSKTDCMLFVEEVIAISRLLHEQRLTLTNLTQEIRKLRYHGKISYCNRNHYFKDWAAENIKKGIIRDIGIRLSGQYYNYPAHAISTYLEEHQDNANYSQLSCIKKREQDINTQEKIGFIPLNKLSQKLQYIHSGDIIGIVRTPKGRADAIHHLAIAYIFHGQVAMIDASSDKHKVILEPSLMQYLAKFKDSQGIVLFRPQ